MSFLLFSDHINGQEFLFEFGEVIPLQEAIELNSGEDKENIKWHNVNTDQDTWELRDSILVCYGNPIGVVRSSRMFENYLLHVEWKHMEPGGNSGMFMWSKAEPGENRLPDGVEVEALLGEALRS